MSLIGSKRTEEPEDPKPTVSDWKVERYAVEAVLKRHDIKDRVQTDFSYGLRTKEVIPAGETLDRLLKRKAAVETELAEAKELLNLAGIKSDESTSLLDTIRRVLAGVAVKEVEVPDWNGIVAELAARPIIVQVDGAEVARWQGGTEALIAKRAGADA